MIIKLIECKVIPAKQGPFSKAQRAWNNISKCSGFQAQLGGWEQITSHGLIVSIWDDQQSIDVFMSEVHDLVVEQNNQNDTYTESNVSHFNVEMLIPMNQSNNRFEQTIGLATAKFIRIADCQLHPGGQSQFLQAQSNICNPMMSSAEGMLGGYVAKSMKGQDRYLVVSFWDSENNHKKYVKNTLPAGLIKVNLDAYMKNLTGHQVLLKKNWSVMPK